MILFSFSTNEESLASDGVGVFINQNKTKGTLVHERGKGLLDGGLK